MPMWSPLRFLLFSLLSLLVFPYGAPTAAAQEEVDNMVVYTLFTSRSCELCAQGQRDGPSGFGTLFQAAGATRGIEPGNVIVTDKGGGGASVRVVNRSGLFTIAGSLSNTGLRNGLASQALFNGPTGVVRVGETLYVVDTDNNQVRKIEGNGVVSTFLSKQKVSAPRYILPYRRPENTYDLFVADTAKSRIIFVALTGTQVVSEYLSGFQPGLMQIATNHERMYAISNGFNIVSINMSSATNNPHYWTFGNISCMGYRAGLMLTEDESELYFYGVRGKLNQILALPTNYSEDVDPSLCPRVVMNWTNGDIVSLVSISSHEFYVVTQTNVYIVRDGTYTATLTVNDFTPTPTPSPTLTVPITPTETIPLTPTPTFTPTLTETISLYRALVFAAFPTVSLPVHNSTLMHELYARVMQDVGIALDTTDFVAIFQPPGNGVPGDVNVSQWNNLTALRSHDGSIVVTEYYTPFGMSSEEAQERLFSSPWYWTREYLKSVPQRSPGTTLEDFCMLRCTTECVELSYRREMCVGYTPPPACDEVCAGAIASSSVLGATAAVLAGLMIASPANVLNAVLLVPAV
ncbi:hypothetical protein LSM04_005702 [Trypanosoma melophagium]|uniref:uncharacterized protein n=1 Tax=Trypanosoma melophagium TaxID=715481 RepID=UPI00351A8CB3|nr:hypothetical protein LSM04_005702 [Trypanosoma melophagium]